MTARRHHYIPQFYLKRFAVERKTRKHQIIVFDRVTGTQFPTSIENVGVERDFNRMELEGVAHDALEVSLASLENEIEPALERTILGGKFETDDDKALIMNLIGLLALRNPRLRESMRKFEEEISKRLLDLALADEGRWNKLTDDAHRRGFLKQRPVVTFEEMRAFQEAGNYWIEVPTETHITREFKGFDAILPYLFEREWTFLRAPRGSAGFITCDHPVILNWSDPSRRGGVNSPGFGLRGTDVMFPLSPRLAIVGSFEGYGNGFELNEESVAMFNGAPISGSTRQVYARDLNFHYALNPGELPRKASHLIRDARFHKRSASREGGDH